MKHFKIKFQKTVQIVMMLSGMMLMLVFSNAQVSDGSAYLPQIKLTADQGFGPYMSGTQCMNTFTISELPENTSRVMFRFLDVDSNLVGQPYYKTGTALTSASWQVDLDALGLPLSPQLHAEVTYKTDSIADYYIAYIVYPDTLSIQASKGWGPFITNNYTFSNNTWHPVPEMKNTFSISHLPLRTEKILFKIITTDLLIMDSLLVTAQAGQYLESAIFQDVRMDNLPLSTHYLEAIIFCHGGPDQGLKFQKLLQVVQQKPRLTTHSGGSTHADTILPCTKAPYIGQALMVDSARHAEISNGPGGHGSTHRGPYSFNLLKGLFTIEAWLKFDLSSLTLNGSDRFIHIDSVFNITLHHSGGTNLTFIVNALIPDVSGIEQYAIYTGEFNLAAFNGKEWHHFAFTLNQEYDSFYKFYFDGVPLNTTENSGNILEINSYHSDYVNYLKTNPLCLGGLDEYDHSYIIAFDEVRIWNSCRDHEEILENMNRHVIQTHDLIAYWDFDDMRNHLNFISDDGILNNAGSLKNGATFIPENPSIFAMLDTLVVNISNTATNQVLLAFFDDDNHVVDSALMPVVNHQVQWVYDLASLPHNTNHLRVFEPDAKAPSGGFETLYGMTVHAPAPIATSQYNWGLVYQSDNNFGKLSYPITVSGFPDNTASVELGLKNGNQYYNTETYTVNSIPYQYSLTFNGTDNYFKSNSQVKKEHFDLSLWFKTSSTKGGVILCNIDVHDPSHQDHVLKINADGSVSFTMWAIPISVALHGSNRYNDGLWHQVRITVDNINGSKLYMDGCLVDQIDLSGLSEFIGSWVIGRDEKNKNNYFSGSLAQVNLTSSVGSKNSVIRNAMLSYTTHLLYKLDEGNGTDIHESNSGSIVPLHGSNQFWNKAGKLSDVIWQHNMIDKPAGTYTFYAKVYYAGGGEQGVYYPLGDFWLKEPFPGYTFSYNFSEGLGYFNEGVAVQNRFVFKTDYTGAGSPFWIYDVLDLQLISPDGQLIDQKYKTWTSSSVHDSVAIDVGDAPPGSYFHVAVGYRTALPPEINYENDFFIPLLVRPMIAPTLSGDFGPFVQAIAPGTMHHNNTFRVQMDGLSDITKVKASFYDLAGNLITSVDGVKSDNSDWTITQNMAVLAPPVSIMKISYYLGAHQFLALVAGPYNITIYKTRPDWFDFVADSCFSNVSEAGDEVTFKVTTPFEKSVLPEFTLDLTVPDFIPLIGGSESKLVMPGAHAKLKYTKSSSRLQLLEPPGFFQEQFNLGSTDGDILSFNFTNTPYDSYGFDGYNNLIASQNFSMYANISAAFDSFEKVGSIVEHIKELVDLIEDADPESAIVEPTFGLSYSGSMQYSSRIRMMTDPVTGKWGSFGNLNVDANPDHEDAYKNSSSFHFLAGTLGMEFSVGMEIFEGLASGNFGIDGQISMGFGQSYVTIPSYRDKFLKAMSFQSYARFYVDVFWGWYEKTVWGPKMIFKADIWDDNLDNMFPSLKTKETGIEIAPKGFQNQTFVTSFGPVSSYSRMPLPAPQSNVESTDDALIFSWLEKGDQVGLRNLRTCKFDGSTKKFSDSKTIESNLHGLNSPVFGKEKEGTAIYTWSQSRHTNETFGAVSHVGHLEEFFRSQDIYFSVYNVETDSVLQTGSLEDLNQGLNDGRAEGEPVVVMLSPSRALITWQVVDPDIPQADIWYAFLDKSNDQWIPTIKGVAVTGEGIESKVKLVSTEEGKALLVWLNTTRDEMPKRTIMASSFDGIDWRVPKPVSLPEDTLCNYLDVAVENDLGALVYTVFVDDIVNGYHEKVKLIPWKLQHFEPYHLVELYVDSIAHVQLPTIALGENGSTAVAVKTERLIKKEAGDKISQVDVFTGNLNFPYSPWKQITASPFVCDTTKQVAEINLAFSGNDTLLMLSQEYPLFSTNTSFVPENGIMFGHPYMNLVLRAFVLAEDGGVEDVDENAYFLGIDKPGYDNAAMLQLQCYPNPCDNHTFLKFNLDGNTFVKLDLYDIRGNYLANLLGQQLNRGMYEMEINTSTLASGTYIIRIITDSSTASVKLMVQ